MLKKTIEKEKRKQRKTWIGLYTRLTPTKTQKKQKEARKEFQKVQREHC